jgi:thiamine biosynthesis lipoprotein
VDLERGGLATSGDARRYVMWQGRRLGHILDPRTGWPVEGAPRSVTVLAPTCLEAGTLATLAILQGAGARAFLESERVQFELVEGAGG